MYILHRKLNQPKSGRRLLPSRRVFLSQYDPDRREGSERRVISDRRQANF